MKGTAFIGGMAAGLIFCTAPLHAETAGDEAAKRLMNGNQRFISGQPAAKDLGDSRRKELVKGQHPFAVILSCSDSRLPPEHIFDQGLGDIFVVRTAGNTLDRISIGSIEYGVEHLHAPLLVILGHQQCGAVKATLDSHGKPRKTDKSHPRDSIGEVIKKIRPAVEQAMKSSAPADVLEGAIRNNVRNAYRELLGKSPLIKELVRSGKLKVMLGEYLLDSGEIKVLDDKNTAGTVF